jgi:glutamate/tyrosine decarboxylase-like PLP-dependent enzyme
MMGMPMICSTILIRQRGTLKAMNDVGGSAYIFHEALAEVPNLGPISLQCGRRNDALKLWLAWRCYGRAGFAERIENLFDLAQRFAKQLDAHPNFERTAPVASLNLCFRYVPDVTWDDQRVDCFNLDAREQLAKSGEALVNYATVAGRPSWRLVLSNGDLTAADMDTLFERIEGACLAQFGAVETGVSTDSNSQVLQI